MYKLTERRLSLAKDILDGCRDKLMRSKAFDAYGLDSDLKNIWKIGYQELKDIMIQMLKLDRFRLVATYYMENVNHSVVSEFHRPLAELYGVDHYHADDREPKREKFWQRAFALENLTAPQTQLLLHLLGKEDERPLVEMETYEQLEDLGLIYRTQVGSWEYTQDGEDLYYNKVDNARVEASKTA